MDLKGAAHVPVDVTNKEDTVDKEKNSMKEGPENTETRMSGIPRCGNRVLTGKTRFRDFIM